MSSYRKLSKVYRSSLKIPFDNSSKIVIISDCHRGDGNWGDNFMLNQNVYFAALTYYFQNGFTYIELGDGDELWENRRIEQIIHVHSNIYWMLTKFYEKNRFYMLYGNHDMIKKNKNYTLEKFDTYYDESTKKMQSLFPNLTVHEGLILINKDTCQQIFLTHGHQVDTLNYDFWILARFLVRFLWSPLELLGLHDPTNTADNSIKKNMVERKLMEWSKSENQMIIAGHTHRPVFPKVGEPLYFNDGSCVHPRCITTIEIEGGNISLIKWTIQTNKKRILYVGREVLEGPIPLENYFTSHF